MEKVPEILEKFEKEKDIQILYAVEAGSRAWGIESEDSDYDIRFIFMHKDARAYVKLDKPKDCYDGFSDDRVYDWQGWDLPKALGLLRQTNPSIIEWIYSPIVYKNENEFNLLDRARAIVEENRRYTPLLFHYRSMAKSNYKDHIEGKDKVKIKKYLYVIRPAGMFYWIVKCQLDKKEGKLVEIDFNLVLDQLKEHIGQEVYDKIKEIIVRKKTLKELDDEPRIECIDKWIDMVLKFPIDNTKHVENYQVEPFNELMFNALKI